jgi:cytochrome P450
MVPELKDYDWQAPAVRACPYPHYERLREQAPVYKVPNTNDYLVTQYEDVVWCLKQVDILSSRRFDDPGYTARLKIPRQRYPLAAGIPDADPPQHTANRAVGFRAFTPARLRSYAPQIRSIVDELIDGFIDAGHADFVADYAGKLPMFVICELFNIPRSLGPQIKHWSDDFIELLSRLETPGRLPVLQESTADFYNFLADELDKRRSDPTDDVFTELAQARDEDGTEYDMATLVNIARVLLLAGHETTAYMLANSMYRVLSNRQVYDEFERDRSIAPRLIEESLRVDAPTQWVARTVVRSFELHGSEIPAGARVIMLVGSANRDPDNFPSPDEVNPHRDNLRDHLAFGFGIHFCLGAPLSRLEGRITLERFFDRLQDIRIESPEVEMKGNIQHLFVPSLKIRFDRRPEG